jgi:hypothetical protein
LFEDKDQNQTLEIFFANTKIGGISARVILNLALNNHQFDYLSSNIKETEVIQLVTKKPFLTKQESL